MALASLLPVQALAATTSDSSLGGVQQSNGSASQTFDLGGGNSATYTPTGPNSINAVAMGPMYGTGSDSTVVNYTPTRVSSDVINFTGTATRSGATQSFNCNISQSTGAESGNCPTFLFGGASSSGSQAQQQTAATAATQGTTRSSARAVTTIVGNRVKDVVRGLLAQRQAVADWNEGRDPQRRQFAQASPAANSAAVPTSNGKLAVWTDISGIYLDNTSRIGSYIGYGVTSLAGVDYVIGDNIVVGFTAGYNRTDLRIDALRNNRIAQGPSFGPYASYIISPNYYVDANFTYTRVLNSLQGYTVPDSNRYTGGANLNAFYQVAPVSLLGTLGYTYSYEASDNGGGLSSTAGSLNSPTTRFGALKLGGEVSYPMGQFEPYIPLAYEYQTTNPRDGSGRHAAQIGVGVRYVADRLTAGFQAMTVERSNAQDVTVSANLRYSF